MAETTQHKKLETKPMQSSSLKNEEPATKTKIVETKKSEPATHKKSEAIVNGRNLSVSLKHATAICNMIRGKEIDTAIKMLEEVEKMKRAVPMRGEIPHRRGMMSGRYPVKAAKIYVSLLKSLKANAIANDLELEKFRIFCMPNNASRPYRRFGTGRFKRSHVLLKLIQITKNENKNKKSKEKK
ncbi:MAG: 50S ribosomal protein L22 [Candidatus Nanoarchaeia archaeon]|nr:50S ribosomal protein L22 [Candidatus Nanoarchaeia archaeon]